MQRSYKCQSVDTKLDYYTEYNITSYSCMHELGPIPVVVTAYGLSRLNWTSLKRQPTKYATSMSS